MFSWFGGPKKKARGKKPRAIGMTPARIAKHHAGHIAQAKREAAYNARKRREDAANTRRYKKLGENA